MEFQAGLTQVKVVRPQTLETTALGAAFFAGLAVGYWKDLAEIRGDLEERGPVRIPHGGREAGRASEELAQGRRSRAQLGQIAVSIGSR